jgi:hypothetical protein
MQQLYHEMVEKLGTRGEQVPVQGASLVSLLHIEEKTCERDHSDHFDGVNDSG